MHLKRTVLRIKNLGNLSLLRDLVSAKNLSYNKSYRRLALGELNRAVL